MNISIITINRNNAVGLKKTIDSVIHQTEPPFEFIIIDGNSADNSVAVIQEKADSISYWVSEPDSGIYNAMNKGIELAHGDWCIFLNSGDAFSSATVLEQLRISGANADIICGNTMILETPPKRRIPPTEVTFDFLFNHAINHQSAAIRRELLKRHPYDESYRLVADRKFFLQSLIIDNCSYQTVNIDFVDYDLTGFSSVYRLACEQEYAQVLEELFPLRIRQDYGRRVSGQLYGDTPYEKLFAEIGRRNWRRPIYRLVRGLLRGLALFSKKARFVRDLD